jgi:hypothetical protein
MEKPAEKPTTIMYLAFAARAAARKAAQVAQAQGVSSGGALPLPISHLPQLPPVPQQRAQQLQQQQMVMQEQVRTLRAAKCVFLCGISKVKNGPHLF